MRDNRYKIVTMLALVCVVLDQITKYIVLQNIPLRSGFTVIPGFFDLVHIRNRGAAFGFLNDPNIQWQFWVFLFATVIAIIAIYILVRDSIYDKILFSGLGLILGGAVGNLIDRIIFREVIDFLDFYVGNWHWPAFNVADIAICCGAFLVLISMWKTKKTDGKIRKK